LLKAFHSLSMNFIEKFALEIGNGGCYKKLIRVLEDENKKVWIDTRVYYNNNPTKIGVCLTKEEFLDLTETLCAIHSGKKNDKYKPFVEESDRQVTVTKEGYLYCITLVKKSGEEKIIKLTNKELETFYNECDKVILTL
jgi:hypothetical protein